MPASGASAVVLNVTAAGPTSASYLTVWPAGMSQPTASDLNWAGGHTVANDVVVALGAGGKVSFFNHLGHTDLIVDVAGFLSGATFVPASTVVLSVSTISQIASVGAGESTITFTGSPSQVTSLLPGNVIDAGPTPQTPYGLLRTVSDVAASGGDTVVTTVPATISDAVTQGSADYSAAPQSYLGTSTSPAPPPAAASPAAGPSAAPHVEGVDPKPTWAPSCGPSGSATLAGGITAFVLTPSFHISLGGPFWQPSVSASASIRLDEAYSLSLTASAGASCALSYPLIPTTPIGSAIPVTLGPVDFTLTPTYSLSASVSVAGSVNTTTAIQVTKVPTRPTGSPIRARTASTRPDRRDVTHRSRPAPRCARR